MVGHDPVPSRAPLDDVVAGPHVDAVHSGELVSSQLEQLWTPRVIRCRMVVRDVR